MRVTVIVLASLSILVVQDIPVSRVRIDAVLRIELYRSTGKTALSPTFSAISVGAIFCSGLLLILIDVCIFVNQFACKYRVIIYSHQIFCRYFI